MKTSRELSAQEAANYLGIEISTLYGWIHENAAPTHAKRFGRLKFRVEDLDAFLKKNTEVRRAYAYERATVGSR